MSPNGVSSGSDKMLILSSSESSDSESFLQEDIKSSGNGINEQWEAIQRTLYQEPGEQVKDPKLVKECKLWRETFPHFRVKGTKVNLKLPENEVMETEKNTQTLGKHFDLKKLEEKRESIKNKIVKMLVDRLVAKYGVTNPDFGLKKKTELKITEINEEENPDEASPKNNLMKTVKNLEPTNLTEKESYFERGKPPSRGSDKDETYISREQAEKSLYEIFDSWEKDIKSATKLPKAYLKGDSDKPANTTTRDSISGTSRSSKPEGGKSKPKKIPPPSALDEMAKPFEMTKKIDKKYEGLVERIMERRHKEIGTGRHCPTSASGLETKNYQEALEKLRIEDGFNDCMKRNTMPRINKFNNNNWLKRREINRYYGKDEEDGDLLPKNSQNLKLNKPKNLNLYKESEPDKPDDKFLEDIKKEMKLYYSRPTKRKVFLEEINLQRPKPLTLVQNQKPSKSLSSGDIQRKTKKETKGRGPRNGPETCKNELNSKSRSKSNNPSKKGNKVNLNKTTLLPPIECDLICTEITGHPKIGRKIPGKRV